MALREQEKARVAEIEALIEERAERGGPWPAFRGPVAGERRVYETVLRNARAAGWDAKFKGRRHARHHGARPAQRTERRLKKAAARRVRKAPDGLHDRVVLASAAMSADDDEADREVALPGDGLVPDAKSQITRAITIDATPAAIWPRLLEMVRQRAPAHEHAVRCVLVSDEPHALVLGALHDHTRATDLLFDEPRPAHFWHATWALVLDPIDERRTRLLVRARVAFTADAARWTAVWMHPFNDFTDPDGLRQLKLGAEGAS